MQEAAYEFPRTHLPRTSADMRPLVGRASEISATAAQRAHNRGEHGIDLG
jgi:hypothetical protein